jgi:hypothetical protein
VDDGAAPHGDAEESTAAVVRGTANEGGGVCDASHAWRENNELTSEKEQNPNAHSMHTATTTTATTDNNKTLRTQNNANTDELVNEPTTTQQHGRHNDVLSNSKKKYSSTRELKKHNQIDNYYYQPSTTTQIDFEAKGTTTQTKPHLHLLSTQRHRALLSKQSKTWEQLKSSVRCTTNNQQCEGEVQINL